MKALRLFGANDIRLVDIPVPEIGDREILLKVEAAAICGTDVRMWCYGKEGVDAENPLTMGHEFAGVVSKVGKDVRFYEPGMRLGLQPNIGCGICDACVSGNFHLCRKYQAFGINMDGAFAEYVRIPEAAVIRGNLAVLPENVSCTQAAVTEPLSCAFNGFSKCFVKPGEYALVVGAGPIGMFHAMLLHMAGAVVLMSDISRERLEDAKKRLPYVDIYFENELGQHVDRWTKGRGLDIAVTACPVPEVQKSVIGMMNFGGRVNFFGGIPEEKQPVAINTNLIHYKELYLTGSTRSSIAQFRKTLEFVAEGLLDVDAIVTDTYAIEEITEAFHNAKMAKGLKHVIQFSSKLL